MSNTNTQHTNEHESFISKYKPYHLDDFDYDGNIIDVVKTLHEIDDLNILFIGTPSCGKTTLLYAIIRDYYGIPAHMNVPETTNIMFVNNLKEQGINFYRNEMKTFCQSHCTVFGKKKMVVVDDIDNINEQSQQVFRNYIDKYKNNVHFISLCTNIQKVIESIQSRVHILRIPPIGRKQLISTMDRIVSAENIVIDEQSKQYLLNISQNSIRNLINHLEKIHILGKPITLDLCKILCSTISHPLFESYINYIMGGDMNSAIHILYNIHDHGYSVIDIFDYFFSFVKVTTMLSEDQKYKIVPLLCKYITIFHNLHEEMIELALFTNDVYSIFHKSM
jgi:DNA polymerase III delta prime subunit